MSTLKTNLITDASGGSNAVLKGVASPIGGMGFRNRIINGDMRIDQRNNGAAINPITNGQYVVDRFILNTTQGGKLSAQQNQGGVTPPPGFTNYVGFTSLSAYALLSTDGFTWGQNIEGFNIADLDWGTASAKPVTLTFVVRSSLTGMFGGSIRNADNTRSYPFPFTINAANTWEEKTVTIPGDTTGAWNKTNGVGMQFRFGLGVAAAFSGPANAWAGANYNTVTGAVSVVGTSGAYFYVTGLQVEGGSVASTFDRRPYGLELMLCQRYYEVGSFNWTMYQLAGNGFGVAQSFAAPKRAAPTLTATTVAAVVNVTNAGLQPYLNAVYQSGYATATGTVVYAGTFAASAEF